MTGKGSLVSIDRHGINRGDVWSTNQDVFF